MVKDSRNRFLDNALLGDGWGWALFKPDDKGANVAQDYKQDCLGCHLPAKSTDLVYTQAYPIGSIQLIRESIIASRLIVHCKKTRERIKKFQQS